MVGWLGATGPWLRAAYRNAPGLQAPA